MGALNLDILNAHTSFRLKEAFEAAVKAEPALARLFYQGTALNSTLVIPDGKGSYIVEILKKGGIQGVLVTGLLFKHLIGPIIVSLKEILGFENVGIEDDIILKGSLFQRILSFYVLKKLFSSKAGLVLQQTKSKSFSLHPLDSSIFKSICQGVDGFGHSPVCLPTSTGFKFCGKYFGHPDWVLAQVSTQIEKAIVSLGELDVLSTLQVQYKLITTCDNQKLSHLLRMYNPDSMQDLYLNWDNEMINWSRTKFNLPQENREIWKGQMRNILSPLKWGGLGFHSLARRAHTGFICAWSAVIADGVHCNPSIKASLIQIKNSADAGHNTLQHSNGLGQTLANCIKRLHLGRTAREILDDSPIPPPLTEKHLRYLPNSDCKGFYDSCAGKGSMRRITAVDQERFFKAQHNAATQISRRNDLDNSSQGRSGASLTCTGVGKSQMLDAAFQHKVQRFLGVPAATQYNVTPPEDVDRSGQSFTRCCRDEHGNEIACPLCEKNLLSNRGSHQSTCIKNDRSITHNQICLQLEKFITNTCGLQTKVDLEQANIMRNGAPAAMQNRRGDLTFYVNGLCYVVDVSVCSMALRNSTTDETETIAHSCAAREQDKRNKYAMIRDEFIFLPFVVGNNGYLSKSAFKVFKILGDAVQAAGRISKHYFISNLIPEFMTVVDRGEYMTQQRYLRKLADKRNPQRCRIIDRIENSSS